MAGWSIAWGGERSHADVSPGQSVLLQDAAQDPGHPEVHVSFLTACVFCGLAGLVPASSPFGPDGDGDVLRPSQTR